MSCVELAIEKVKRLDENQAEALLEWLELRENREALRRRLDREIELGLNQLKKGKESRARRFTPRSANEVESGAPS
jgi:hypothetical protein